ncbi:MAG: PAS domain S-box protein [Bacteroidales bacterium]|nr:PAS domain S-box protein [Bacteroidales bacterium]MBN2755643.1 PAS domain S-box protein [Bacteroidales bacterium]
MKSGSNSSKELEKRILVLEEENKKLKEQLVKNSELSANEHIDVQSEEIRAINEEMLATNDALKESESNLQLFIDEAVDSILISDYNGNINYVNKSTIKLTGYSKSELLKLNLKNLFTEESLSESPFRYDLMKKGQPVSKQRYIKTKNENPVFVEMRSKSLPSGELQTIFRDMTEWLNKERINRQFKTIFDYSPDAIFQINEKGIITNCNNAYAKEIRLDVDEIKGKHSSDFIANKEFSKHGFIQLQKEGYYEAEVEELRADGTHTKAWRKAVALLNSKNKFTGAIVFNRNIEKKIKDAEMQLKLTAAVEQSANTVIITDSNGIIEYVNQKFVDTSGFSKEEAIGKHTRILKSGNHKPEYYKELWYRISSGKQWLGEFHNKKKKGEFYWESATISPIINIKGEILNYVAIKEDITIKKDTERRLIERNREFEELYLSNVKLNDKLLSLNIKLEERNENIEKINNFLIEAQKIGRIGTWEYVFEKDSLYLSGIGRDILGLNENDEVSFEISKNRSHPDDYQTYNNAIKETIVNHKPYNVDRRIKLYNDKIIHIHEQGQIYFDKSGKPIRFSGIMQDISERVLAEENLRKSEETYRNIFNSSSECIFIHDAETGVIVDVNKSIQKMYGYNEKEIIGLTIENLSAGFEPYRIKDAAEYIAKTINEGDQSFDWMAKRKDGTIFWTGVNLTYQEIAGIKRVVATVRDISSRKESENNLIESEDRLKSLSNATFEAITISVNSEIIDVNDTAMKLFGFTYEEFIGGSVLMFVAENYKEKVTKKMLDGYEKPYEFVAVKKDGTNFEVQVQGKNTIYKGQKARVTAIRDITSLKAIEKELVKAKIKAEESDRLKSAFLANMSHEIRTPMNGIIGFSELLGTPDISGDQREKYIDVIRQSSNQLLHIIDDILDISKIEVGEVKIVKGDFNANVLINDMKHIFDNEIIRRNLKVKLISKTGLRDVDAIIDSDQYRIRQVFTNLINNAIKFTKEGEIEIGYTLITPNKKQTMPELADIKENMLLFYVKDTGLGIVKEKQKLIFDRFRQSDESHSREYGGTGLGLSISKGLIEILDGNIWLVSESGIGSTFYFTLPYTHKNISELNYLEETKIIKITELKNLHILIVEDDEMNLFYLKEIFSSVGAKITHAKNGRDALALTLKHSDIDIILMDIQMPVMDGFEATKQIKKLKSKLPIIAQTAHAMVDDKYKALEAGCDDYISKPINKEELIAKILKLV